MHLSDDQPLAPAYLKSMNNLRMALMACTAGLVITGPVEESLDLMHKIAEELTDQVTEKEKQIRGNRHGNTILTYSDARLVLARTLEVCMNRLDNHRAGS